MKVEKLLKLMDQWDCVILTDPFTIEILYIGRVDMVPDEIRSKEARTMFVNESGMLRIEVR